MSVTLQKPPAGAEPTPFRWTREEYHRAGQAGVFQGRRAQLIDGEVVEMSPQGGPHFTACDKVAELLRRIFVAGYWVRMQGPLSIAGESEPEPDVAVVRGNRDDFRDAHPTTALLVVEVGDTSLSFDRRIKGGLYGRGGIPEYWILDINGEKLEVLRDPVADPSQPSGFRYSSTTIIAADGHVSPLAAPQDRIAVADMLP